RDLEQGAGDVVPQLFADAAALGVGVVPEHDHGQGVHHLARQQKVQPHQVARAVLFELIVVAGVAPAAALDGVEKVIDDLAQGHGVVQVHPDVVQVLHVDQDAPLLLAQVHQAAHIVVGGVEVDVHKGLFLFGDLGGVGVFGGVGDGLDLPVGEGDPVLDAGGGGDKVEVELPLQPLGDDLHVQKAQKAADRKSTRLNSSHVSISYAVFCLKKKKWRNQYRA